MKYACLIYHSEEKMLTVPEAELVSIMQDCGVWIEDLERAGKHVFSSGLQSIQNAITFRTQQGELSSTDGPFAETKEFLGGFTIFEARDLNEAIQIASKMPSTRIGSLELRPAFDPTLPLTSPIDQKIAKCLVMASHSCAGGAKK